MFTATSQSVYVQYMHESIKTMYKFEEYIILGVINSSWKPRCLIYIEPKILNLMFPNFKFLPS